MRLETLRMEPSRQIEETIDKGRRQVVVPEEDQGMLFADRNSATNVQDTTQAAIQACFAVSSRGGREVGSALSTCGVTIANQLYPRRVSKQNLKSAPDNCYCFCFLETGAFDTPKSSVRVRSRDDVRSSKLSPKLLNITTTTCDRMDNRG
jgi:hypothetical protein